MRDGESGRHISWYVELDRRSHSALFPRTPAEIRGRLEPDGQTAEVASDGRRTVCILAIFSDKLRSDVGFKSGQREN
jgi:hypothetical protein